MGTARRFWWGSAAALAACLGCDSIEIPGQVKDAADKAKAIAQQGVEAVKEEVGLAGGMQLHLREPVKPGRCYVRLFVTGGNRKNLLQISSHLEPENESYPSAFFHAQVSQTSLAELAGQNVAGELYVQPVQDGPIWRSEAARPAIIKITAVDGANVKAEIVEAKLQSTDGEAEVGATGTFAGSSP